MKAWHERRERLQVLACDIDGTLMGDDGVIPAANVAALSRIRDAGVFTVLSSGRALVSVRGVAARMFPPRSGDFYIAFNGAQIARGLAVGTPSDADGGTEGAAEMILDARIRPAVISKVADYARGRGLVLQAYEGTRFLVEADSEVSRRYARDTDMSYRVVSSLSSALPEGSPKLLVIGEPDRLQEYKAEIDALAKEPSSHPPEPAPHSPEPAPHPHVPAEAGDVGFVATFSKPHFLELLPPAVSKGAALAYLCEYLGIPLRNTVAIGDAPNDLEMMEEAGIGVAVANAREEVRGAADLVTDRAAAEGAVAEVIDHLLPPSVGPGERVEARGE
jgi:hydroxymethylpyrimidine pyrophosphatase-like HAD family hydrolase